MNAMKLLFAHGWGFDRTFWSPLVALLADVPHVIDDRGYFGAPEEPGAELAGAGPVIAVTHSLGTMRVLADPPPGLAGIVAINGFDRFTAIPGRPGVPMRVVDHMLGRFEKDPRAVLASFRASIGCEDPFGAIDAVRLEIDLKRLRDGQPPLPPVPIVVLHGTQDPLLPEPMRRAGFSGGGLGSAAATDNLRRIEIEGGHLLPLEYPERCAQVVRGMLAV